MVGKDKGVCMLLAPAMQENCMQDLSTIGHDMSHQTLGVLSAQRLRSNFVLPPEIVMISDNKGIWRRPRGWGLLVVRGGLPWSLRKWGGGEVK